MKRYLQFIIFPCLFLMFIGLGCNDFSFDIAQEESSGFQAKGIDAIAISDVPPITDLMPFNRQGRCVLPVAAKLGDGLDQLLNVDCLPVTGNRLTAQSLKFHIQENKVLVIAHLVNSEMVLEKGSQLLDGVEVMVERQVDTRVQLWVKLNDLLALSQSNQIQLISNPQRARGTATSEGVSIIGADTLHTLGNEGAGVTIAVLDGGFDGYTGLIGTDLPLTVTTESFYPGGDITGDGLNHGTTVAEIAYDMAPGADFVFVNYETNLDFHDAIDWLIDPENGVDVITTSVGFNATGPMDGTDEIAVKADTVRDAGIIFDASAGNYAQQHHYSAFTPSSTVPVYHDFGSSNIALLNADDEYVYALPVDEPIILTLVWDDWGIDPNTPSSTEDYALHLLIYYEETWQILSTSDVTQDGTQLPRESIGVYAPLETYYAVLIENISTTRNCELNLFSEVQVIDPSAVTTGQSVNTPCVAENVLCVGATDHTDVIRPYSSNGPTIPNEITGLTIDKPDLVAPDGVSTETYGLLPDDGFYGTSASAPHVGGAAALYLEMYCGDVDAAENALLTGALDLGFPGYDNVYGFGRVQTLNTCTDEDVDGVTTCCGDCDDRDGEVYPGAPELCDTKNNDCDLETDEGCASWSVPIYAGINILGLTLDYTGLTLASEIATDIALQGGSVIEIYKWDYLGGSWMSYDPTFPIVDFPLDTNEGFIVRAGAPSTWGLYGQSEVDGMSVNTTNGYTLVAVPSDSYALASDLESAMTGAGCAVQEMSRWVANSQSWETYDPTFPIINYALDRTSGYFLKGSGNCAFSLP